MVNDLPAHSIWSLAGIGDNQFVMNAAAIIFGGGVRIGLEDNIWYDVNRTRLATNVDLLKRVHLVAETFERDIMKPAKLREILGLKSGFGEYGCRDNRESLMPDARMLVMSSE